MFTKIQRRLRTVSPRVTVSPGLSVQDCQSRTVSPGVTVSGERVYESIFLWCLPDWVSEWVRVFKRRMKADSCYALLWHVNKNDFNCRRNSPVSLSDWWIMAGRLFQNRGPVTAKLWSLSCVLVHGTQQCWCRPIVAGDGWCHERQAGNWPVLLVLSTCIFAILTCILKLLSVCACVWQQIARELRWNLAAIPLWDSWLGLSIRLLSTYTSVAVTYRLMYCFHCSLLSFVFHTAADALYFCYSFLQCPAWLEFTAGNDGDFPALVIGISVNAVAKGVTVRVAIYPPGSVKYNPNVLLDWYYATHWCSCYLPAVVWLHLLYYDAHITLLQKSTSEILGICWLLELQSLKSSQVMPTVLFHNSSHAVCEIIYTESSISLHS